MFGWGRKKDGFEWHKYVRTTIKLRREDRRARILDAKEVASDGLKYAGRASVSAGNSGAVMAWNGLISGIQMLIKVAIAGGEAMARTVENKVVPLGRRFLGAFDPWLKPLARSPLMPMLGVVGVVALYAAYGRWRGTGARGEVVLIALVGVFSLALAIAPVLAGHLNLSKPKSIRGLAARLRPMAASRRGMGVVAAMALLLGGGYLASRSVPAAFNSLANLNPFMPKVVEGRAVNIGGDVLRINGTAIRLAGIEAPEADQKCVGANKKKWSCGEAARSALQRIVNGRTVRCELSGTDTAGRALGTCQTVNTGNSQDVAAALVKEGAVFSDGGLFSSYGALESDAKAKKSGIWRGEAERPAEYREKLWEAAAKAAPDGCPIKGQIAGDAKTYVMPWSPDYGGARVRTTRGERWFCSEGDAQAAGWKVASR